MYSKKIDEVLTELNTTRLGLGTKEADKRLKQNGKNELKKAKKESLIVCFFKQFLNIMVGILLFAAIVSISVAIIKKQYEDLYEGFVILFIVIMNAIIGVYQENKAQACLNDLQKYNKISVKTIRNGVTFNIDSTELVVGDIIELVAGNVVTADIRLIETNNFSCDESSLTGESVPQEKNADLVLKKTTLLADRKNMCYSGSMVTSGKAKGVVVATGQNTEIGKIANVIFNAKKEVTPLQKSIDKIGKVITYTVLAVCLIIFVIELIQGHNLMDTIMVSVSLAVAAIPESLPAVITIIMALGVQQLAKRRCIIKHLHAVETLGSCEIICTDKTGTLTQNKMEVVESFSNLKTNAKLSDEFIKCMKLCTNAKRENGLTTGEPTEKAIFDFTLNYNLEKSFEKIHEIPFNSTRKMMSVLINDDGIKSYTKGALERVLDRCKYIEIDGENVLLDENIKNKIVSASKEMADKALRVIAFAYKKLDDFNSNDEVESDLVFLGLVGMMDRPRPEIKESIQKCFSAGLKPVMITGDNKNTAFAIAKELGIAKSIDEVMSGDEIDKLSDKELIRLCPKFTVFARVSPEHKVRIVNSYKGLNKIVAMTGDGINDAPSLKIADIGVGMGKSGTDVVRNVADMVITDDNFSSIVVAVEEGRKVYHNIQKALEFLISTNCVEVFGMLISLLLFPKFIFLTPVQMLFINLVTDSLPAFALGVEKVEPEFMKEPPRNSKAGLFAGRTGISIIYEAILQTVIVIAMFMIGIFCYTPEVASTMVFFTIIFMQLLHSINCKSHNTIFDKSLYKNKTFILCFIITLILNLSVAILPFMYTLFDLEFLNFSQWIMIIIASVLIIPTCELMKAILSKEKILEKEDKKIKIRRKKA